MKIDDFKNEIKKISEERKDFTSPENGWPWPWNDSNTTDYAYVFENKKVDIYCFGEKMFLNNIGEWDSNEVEVNIFPNMENVKNIQWGKKSGLIII